MDKDPTQAAPSCDSHPFSEQLLKMNSTTTQTPPFVDGGGTVGYVLVPFFLITLAGIVAAVVSARGCMTSGDR